jgi:hypothetical protein
MASRTFAPSIPASSSSCSYSRHLETRRSNTLRNAAMRSPKRLSVGFRYVRKVFVTNCWGFRRMNHVAPNESLSGESSRRGVRLDSQTLSTYALRSRPSIWHNQTHFCRREAKFDPENARIETTFHCFSQCRTIGRAPEFSARTVSFATGWFDYWSECPWESAEGNGKLSELNQYRTSVPELFLPRFPDCQQSRRVRFLNCLSGSLEFGHRFRAGKFLRDAFISELIVFILDLVDSSEGCEIWIYVIPINFGPLSNTRMKPSQPKLLLQFSIGFNVMKYQMNVLNLFLMLNRNGQMHFHLTWTNLE